MCKLYKIMVDPRFFSHAPMSEPRGQKYAKHVFLEVIFVTYVYTVGVLLTIFSCIHWYQV